MKYDMSDLKIDYLNENELTKVELNVLDKEETESVIAPVFKSMSDVLGKSLGAYGAPTIISIYPESFTTKDGFTIMKYLEPKHKLHKIFYTMAFRICERLNNLVGDGTTSSIVATNGIYEAYLKRKNFFKENMITPKAIMEEFDNVKNELINILKEKAIKINNLPKEEMLEYIRKVVDISSNNDETITNNIVELYDQLGFPAIDLTLSPDGTTHSYIVNGFPANVILNDVIYINNDNKSAIEKDVDVIMFSHKVSNDTYETIIKPLSAECRMRGRKLVVIAPFYDEVAIRQNIRHDLMAEYEKTNSINTILTTCRSTSSHDKHSLNDLAMLLNTTLISRALEQKIIEKVTDENYAIGTLIAVDRREAFPDLNIAAYNENNEALLIPYKIAIEKGYTVFGDHNEHELSLGHCSSVTLGLKSSIFNGFNYNQGLYEQHLLDAKIKLQEAENKYKEMGVFNIEITDCQKRVFSLGLKVGKIEVGAESEIKQKFLRDVYDDAVKAAASAYENGIVLGCNVTLLRAIASLFGKAVDNKLKWEVLTILKEGFLIIYKTVLGNMVEDLPMTDDVIDTILKDIPKESINYSTLYETIVDYSISNDCVFDLRTLHFSKDIINSVDTDIQILNATVGLLSMLISGNQLVSSVLLND